MAVTRIGLQIPTFTFGDTEPADIFDNVATIARTAESSGFDSLWVMDHFYQIPHVGPRTDPMLEAYTLLGAIAARTESISLGTLVTGVTYRNPALLAKQVTTLDILSRGRAILGIGAAWNDDEHAGYGYAFPPTGERMTRLAEAIDICRAMFRNDEATIPGRHYAVTGALNYPRPVRGDIPILVGGSGERRTLRIVAERADACNLFGDTATVTHKLGVLARHCADVGRDPASITKTRLGGMLIADTNHEAETRARAVASARGVGEDRLRGYTVFGDDDAVTEQVAGLLATGLDGVVFNMFGPYTAHDVARAGAAIARAFG